MNKEFNYTEKDTEYYTNYVNIESFAWNTGGNVYDVLNDAYVGKEFYTDYIEQFQNGQTVTYVRCASEGEYPIFACAGRDEIYNDNFILVGPQKYAKLTITRTFSDGRDFPINIMFDEIGGIYLTGRGYELIVHMDPEDVRRQLKALTNNDNERTR